MHLQDTKSAGGEGTARRIAWVRVGVGVEVGVSLTFTSTHMEMIFNNN